VPGGLRHCAQVCVLVAELMEPGAAGADEFVCWCTRTFPTEKARHTHRIKAGCTPQAAPEPQLQVPQAKDSTAKVEALTSRISEEWLQTLGEMHFDHYHSQASIARQKDAAWRIAQLQSSAIKAALDGKLLPGVQDALDELIDPIMAAIQRFHNPRTEADAREKRLVYKLRPRRRVLATIDSLKENSRGKLIKCTEELIAYDLPLEESMQRELILNPAFAAHLQDWGEVRPRPANLRPSEAPRSR
jgi:hypothetical protein